MDEAVNTRARLFLSGLIALVAATAATAQSLPDPTRPPANLLERSATTSAAAAPVNRAPRLQSVLIARQPGGRHVAVIDGETLRLGELYKGARVTRIEQNEVELVRGRVRQVLKLDAPSAGSTAGIERARNE
jgi:MSHA biogenesis protein MshK